VSDGWLDIGGDEYRWYIAWFFEDDGEGGALGESTHTEKDLENATPEDREHILATLTAQKTEGWERGNFGVLTWESLTKAKAALRAVKAALKSDKGGKWPEWAVKAQAAGWKPPKGWKP